MQFKKRRTPDAPFWILVTVALCFILGMVSFIRAGGTQVPPLNLQTDDGELIAMSVSTDSNEPAVKVSFKKPSGDSCIYQSAKQPAIKMLGKDSTASDLLRKFYSAEGGIKARVVHDGNKIVSIQLPPYAAEEQEEKIVVPPAPVRIVVPETIKLPEPTTVVAVSAQQCQSCPTYGSYCTNGQCNANCRFMPNTGEPPVAVAAPAGYQYVKVPVYGANGRFIKFIIKLLPLFVDGQPATCSGGQCSNGSECPDGKCQSCPTGNCPTGCGCSNTTQGGCSSCSSCGGGHFTGNGRPHFFGHRRGR